MKSQEADPLPGDRPDGESLPAEGLDGRGALAQEYRHVMPFGPHPGRKGQEHLLRAAPSPGVVDHGDPQAS
ncbi:MAG: hypothetical protein M0T83_07755, partial [Nitrospiraceae bacterium]|nr:hypothetical protein [Nitrospiraceae bacterium]